MTSRAAPNSDALNLAFVGWAWGIFVVGAVAMLLGCRHVTGGRIIYVVDDAAIHLKIAATLLHHGTWGIQPGIYQSASSSPLWGLLLAGLLGAARTMDILPWILNLFAGLWLIWAIGCRQQVIRPGRAAPLSVLATAGLVTVVLFMPSLSMVGMEHLLHSAMVVQLVAWIHDRAVGRRTRTPAWAPYVLAALAVLTRFETMWVVAGVGLGYLIDGWVRDRHDRPVLAGRMRTVAGLGLVTAAPVVGYSILNRSMGQGFLPNSVVAKTAISELGRFPITPKLVIDHLTADPLLAFLFVTAIAYLALARLPAGQSIVPAVTLIAACLAHAAFAQYGYFERYQAYLIAIGVYFALSASGEVVPNRTKAVAVVALAALLVTPVKWNLLFLTPRGADNTYQQRYQAALFVRRYYQGRPIATGELGYISLLHQGSITDLLGLGDYEVLQQRKRRTDNRAFYASLAVRRQFPIVLSYSGAIGSRTPTTWYLVASWDLHGAPITALAERFQFWATTPVAALELRADLMDNAHRLPHHVRQVLNRCLDAQLGDTANSPSACSTPSP